MESGQVLGGVVRVVSDELGADVKEERREGSGGHQEEGFVGHCGGGLDGGRE